MYCTMHIYLLALSFIHSFAVAHPLLPTPSQDDVLTLYVAHQACGILTLSFDQSKAAAESLQVIATNTQGGYHPQWLTLTENGRLYSLSRQQFPNASSVDGGIFSFKRQDDLLKLQNAVDSGGDGGVYVDVSPDRRTLAAANIDGSTVSIHPLTPSGFILPATYLYKYTLATPGPGHNDSQLIPNPHESIFSPSGTHTFSPDRGSDLLRIYRVRGPYDVDLYQTLSLLPGTGPRHITFRSFSPTRTYMYLISELDNTVRVYTLDTPLGKPDELQVDLRQTISTLCAGCNRTLPTGVDLASEIAISPDGKFAYASNRNTDPKTVDNVAIFAVRPGLKGDTQHLTFLTKNKVDGKIPRHFSISGDQEGRYVVVGNEATNDIKIFEREARTGMLGALKGSLSLGELDGNLTMGPTCVVWG